LISQDFADLLQFVSGNQLVGFQVQKVTFFPQGSGFHFPGASQNRCSGDFPYVWDVSVSVDVWEGHLEGEKKESEKERCGLLKSY